MKDIDVVLAVTYYAPYVSGLTEVVRAEAEGLAALGYKVVVVTNQHDPSLPTHDWLEGVRVVRCPVDFKMGRGTFAFSFVETVLRYSSDARVLHIHAPMLDAGLIVRRARRHVKVVLTHHIDLWLPTTLRNIAALAAVDISTRVAIRHADVIIVNSEDQALGSKYWPLISGRSWTAVPAACQLRDGGSPRYRRTNGRHFGFLGRIVEDKGLGYLVEAFKSVTDPHARLLIGGDYLTVAGGSIIDSLQSKIKRDPRIQVLGLLCGKELNDFYASIDVFVLPSLAESFGIVQAEGIMLGVPSITTNIPGGRYPVVSSGLGRLVAPKDVDSLAKAMCLPYEYPEEQRVSAAKWARTEFGLETFIARHIDILCL